jgi:hypothetical protein
MMRKLLNVFAFFKSTLTVNVAISLFAFILGGVNAFISAVVTFGFFGSLAIKEIYNKSNYIFYFNNGLSKGQLWLFSYLMSWIFVLLLASILILLKRLF